MGTVWTVFTMPVCLNVIRKIIKYLRCYCGKRWPATIAAAGMLFTICFCGPVYSQDSGFSITSARTELINKVYHLSAEVEYRFSEDVLEALQSGVAMVVLVEIELVRPRRYWLDDTIAELEQRFRLDYHALAEQYIVKNLNSGAQYTAPTLNTALFYLKDIKQLPLIDKQLLDEEKTYQVRAKVSLEFDTLPVPLKLSAYTSRSWWLGSDWYSWDL